MRWRKYGDPGEAERRRASNGAGYTDKGTGYRGRRDPDHPLADVTGRVLEHRAVLYDTIGPGPHSCHWCGTELYWHRRPTEHPSSALCVDHIDENKLNNDPTNLVPSCLGCNSRRALKSSNAVDA